MEAWKKVDNNFDQFQLYHKGDPAVEQAMWDMANLPMTSCRKYNSTPVFYIKCTHVEFIHTRIKSTVHKEYIIKFIATVNSTVYYVSTSGCPAGAWEMTYRIHLYDKFK